LAVQIASVVLAVQAALCGIGRTPCGSQAHIQITSNGNIVNYFSSFGGTKSIDAELVELPAGVKRTFKLLVMATL